MVSCFISMRNGFSGWSNGRIKEKEWKIITQQSNYICICSAIASAITSIFHLSIIDRSFWYFWFFNKPTYFLHRIHQQMNRFLAQPISTRCLQQTIANSNRWQSSFLHENSIAVHIIENLPLINGNKIY